MSEIENRTPLVMCVKVLKVRKELSLEELIKVIARAHAHTRAHAHRLVLGNLLIPISPPPFGASEQNLSRGSPTQPVHPLLQNLTHVCAPVELLHSGFRFSLSLCSKHLSYVLELLPDLELD